MDTPRQDSGTADTQKTTPLPPDKLRSISDSIAWG